MRAMLRNLVLVVLLAALQVPLVGQLQSPLTPEAALTRVLQQSPIQADWFDSSFLAAVPQAQVEQIVKQYLGQLGAFQKLEATSDGYRVVMERGEFPAKIVLNTAGRITGLWFGVPELKTTGLNDTIKEFEKLPGKISVVVVQSGRQLAGLQPDLPLAVGSTFKLAILAALQEQIAAGKHHLDEVQPLKSAWKSLPSGVLQQWPDGTPLTLATLANEMISISDNTAADALLAIVGRENAEKYAARTKPFLSTREAFIVKASSNSALLARYRAADASARRAMLDEIDRQPLPDVSQITGAPTLDVEWYFSVNELCTLMGKVADEPAMHINPGVATPADWKQIAFKGGSENGVLNLTTMVTARDGTTSCISATWNNTESLDQTRFLALYRGLLSDLPKGAKK